MGVMDYRKHLEIRFKPQIEINARVESCAWHGTHERSHDGFHSQEALIDNCILYRESTNSSFPVDDLTALGQAHLRPHHACVGSSKRIRTP